LAGAGFGPQTEPAEKGIVVVARPAAGWQNFKFMNIAASENYVIGFKGGNQSFHDIRDVLLPFDLPMLFQTANSDIILERRLFVRQVAQFHRFEDAFHNHGRTEAGAQSEEQHSAAPITPQGLHGGVIDDFHRSPECRPIIKTNPALAQVKRFSERPIMTDRSGVAEGNRIILPILRELAHARQQHRWSQPGAGREFAVFLLSRHEQLDVGSTNINGQHLHELDGGCLSAALLDAITASSSFQDFTNDSAPSS